MPLPLPVPRWGPFLMVLQCQSCSGPIPLFPLPSVLFQFHCFPCPSRPLPRAIYPSPTASPRPFSSQSHRFASPVPLPIPFPSRSRPGPSCRPYVFTLRPRGGGSAPRGCAGGGALSRALPGHQLVRGGSARVTPLVVAAPSPRDTGSSGPAACPLCPVPRPWSSRPRSSPPTSAPARHGKRVAPRQLPAGASTGKCWRVAPAAAR